jgi:polar amino acid transport system substrate-binding protein
MKLINRLIAVTAVALSTASTPLLAAEPAIDEIQKRGSIRVGMSPFVPWAMRDKNGELIGFEIDVAKQLAKDMDVAVEFIPTAWDGIIPALLAGKFDVIIGGMSITEERSKTVDFTVPYAHSSLGVMANKEVAESLSWPDDYNSTDVTFVCRRGATPCNYIQTEFPKAQLRQFDDQGQTLQEVLNGNAHAMISSQPLPAHTIFDNPEIVFSPTEEKIDPGNEAFALRKDDTDSLEYFSNWINQNTENGFLDERHQYWFGGRSWANQLAE